MSFLAVKTKLVSILNEITGEGEPLQKTFAYFEPSPQEFPAAMVRSLGASSEERLDSGSNFLTMLFTIRIVTRTKNTETAEDDLLGVVDAILDKFRAAENVDTLGGIVEKFDILSVEEYESQTDQPIIGFDITVAASKIKAI